jgi:hypothetical protein
MPYMGNTKPKQYKREFYVANREKYLSKAKLKYAENRETILARRKESRKLETPESKDKRLQYLKKWRKRNQDTVKAYFQKDELKFKSYLKASALRRGHEFKLSYSQFIELFHQSCSYCGKKDARGIDRVDNSKGYILENCVGCCGICNKMKWRLTKEEFISQVKLIYKHSIIN